MADLAALVGLIPGFVYEQYQTSAATGYAGSVSGLRPEATAADLVRTGFVMVWAAVWLGISTPMAVAAYRSHLAVGGGQDWFWLMPAAFVFIGLLVLAGTLVKLVGGGFAIWQNQRQRRLAS